MEPSPCCPRCDHLPHRERRLVVRGNFAGGVGKVCFGCVECDAAMRRVSVGAGRK